MKKPTSDDWYSKASIEAQALLGWCDLPTAEEVLRLLREFKSYFWNQYRQDVWFPWSDEPEESNGTLLYIQYCLERAGF